MAGLPVSRLGRAAILVAGFEHLAFEELRIRREMGQISREDELTGRRQIKERRRKLPGTIRSLLEV